MEILTRSHDELIALVEQQATIAHVEQRIRDLEDGIAPLSGQPA